MGRLKHVERDVADLKRTVVQVSEILVDLADRMDRGFESQRRETAELRRSLGDRLDRDRDQAIEERTASTDRLRDIESRLSRLEERIGPGSPGFGVRSDSSQGVKRTQQQAKLDRRLVALDRDGPIGTPWETVRARMSRTKS